MPRPAKPFLHRGYWITTVGGGQTRLATAAEGEAVARERLAAFLAERAAGALPVDTGAGGSVTVQALADLWHRHAERYYRRPDGRPTVEARNHKYSIGELAAKCPALAADRLDRAMVRELRDTWIGRGVCRDVVNQRVSQIQRMLWWAAEEGHIRDETAERVSLLSPLTKGRTAAPDHDPVEPVALEAVRATVSKLSEPWRSLAIIGWHSGARPGELCSLRVDELRTDGRGWWIDKTQHKTRHRKKVRRIPLSEYAMRGLAPWLFLAEAHGRAIVFPSVRKRGAGQPGHVAEQSYRDAVAETCAKQGIPHWHPNQLRHSFASRLRDAAGRFDLDDIREGLSHSKTDMTDHYAKIAASRTAILAAKLS